MTVTFRSIAWAFAVRLVRPQRGVAQGTDFALPDAVALDCRALLPASDRIGAGPGHAAVGNRDRST